MSNSSSPANHAARYYLLGVLSALVVFLLGALAFWLASRYLAPASDAEAPGKLYDQAWKIIEGDYIGQLPSPTERTYGAIKGSVEKLGDPYSFFVEPEPAKRDEEQLAGKFGGIGAYLTLDKEGRIVLDPMVERPAASAGVAKDDVLLAVDGKPIPTPADADQVTALLRGPVGSVVKITVLRGQQQLDFAIKRDQIELPSVTWRVLDTAAAGQAGAVPLGYVRIERFSALTDKELTQGLAELAKAGATGGLVLDLRGNPGGLLDAGVDVASHFLDGGPVVIERQANGSQRTYNARAGGDALQAPLVVLVDNGTASAAEIVAGALQDRGRARLVGAKTYGKGSVQHVHRLADNSALHVTFARWYTPNDRLIDHQGLSPDVDVSKQEPPPQGDDPTLQAGIDSLLQSSPS